MPKPNGMLKPSRLALNKKEQKMSALISTQVWDEIEKQIFAVIGMVTAKNEARTAGVVYVVHQHKLYIGSLKTAWKARHIAQNPHVSMTIPIAKRVLFLPWLKIPAATITFSGVARVLEAEQVSEKIVQALFRGMDLSPETSPPFAIIEVTPKKEFITYGVGVSLLTMRDQEKALGRVPVS